MVSETGKNVLLCTFTKTYKLSKTIEQIKSTYVDSIYGKIFILQDVENPDTVFCTYNAMLKDNARQLANTISINRKKETNTLYSINALNFVVSIHNDGKLDPTFTAPWEKYQNCLLTIDKEDLKVIHTKLYDIVELG